MSLLCALRKGTTSISGLSSLLLPQRRLGKNWAFNPPPSKRTLTAGMGTISLGQREIGDLLLVFGQGQVTICDKFKSDQV